MFALPPGLRDSDEHEPIPLRSSWQAILFSRRMLFLVLFVIILSALSAMRPPQYPDVEAGELAPETVTVPVALAYEDHEATEQRKELVIGLAPQTWRYDQTPLVEENLRRGLERELARVAAADTGEPELLAQVRQVTGSVAARTVLLEQVVDLGRRLLLRGVVETQADADRLAHTRHVRLVRHTLEREISIDSHTALPAAVRTMAVDSYVAMATTAHLAMPELAGRLLAAALPVNLKCDDQATRQAQDAALQQVVPVMVSIPAGTVAVQKGEKLTVRQARILAELRQLQAQFDGLAVVGFAGFFAVALMSFLIFLFKFFPAEYADAKSLALLGILFLLPLCVLRVLQIFTTLPGNVVYLMPVAAVSALVALLFSPRLAVYFNVFAALATSLYAGMTIIPFLVHWGAGMVAIFAVARIQRRSHIVRAGLWVGGAMVTMFLLGRFLSVEPGPNRVLFEALGFSLLNGLFVTPVAIIGLLVFFEDLFDRTTNFRLLELADLGNDLLREMLLRAAGTYQHSLTVGMLAENAAEEVGARPLLARVGAYYHDIGKLERPEYFSENQNYMEQNRHGALKPSLSAAILKAHVKEGVDRARTRRLPTAIVDIIRQHHGTGVMQYFYCQALETEEDGAVTRDDYQYPGPKPQTREAAIVMLADSTEAAARTMKNPTPVNIAELVKRIINGKFGEGELEDCDLTLRDLRRIDACFTRLLTSMYHTRVEYPDEAKLRALEKAQKDNHDGDAATDPASGN
ncbi:MAG TPA: HDIG domain-containing protein [bacterium]|nr:HDIG domain-containing protein [bacterium]